MTSAELIERETRLQLLTLSDSFSEDEWGNIACTFVQPPLQLSLVRNQHDGDTSITLILNGATQPIVQFDVNGCLHFQVKEEAATTILELVAVSELDYRTRGTYRADTGLLITVKPFIQLRPFFHSESASASDQRFPTIQSGGKSAA